MTRRIDLPGVIIATILTLIIVVPLFVVATWSVSNVWRYPAVLPQEFGLRYWKMTLARSDVWTSICMSLKLAAMVTLLSQ